MKTHLIVSLLLLPALLHAQSDIVPLTKKRSDNTLVTSFESGAKTIKISAAGTLEFETGFTLNGGTILRDAMGASTGGSGYDDAGKLVVFGNGGLITSVQFVASDAGSFGTLTPNSVVFSNGTNFTALTAPVSILGSYVLRLPSISANATLISNNDTGTVTNGMLAGSIAVSKLNVSSNVASLLGAANYGAMRTQLGLVVGTDVQAYDVDLTTYAGITPSANVQSLLGAANYAAMRTLFGLVIGTNVQAYDVDLTTYAGITPSANVQSLLGAANYAAMRTQLGLVVGTDVLAFSASSGSGNLVRVTSPTVSEITSTGKVFFAGTNNYIWRSGAGDTEIVTATNNLSVKNSSATSIMQATTTGLTLPGLVVDAGTAWSYPGGYPTLPNYENFARGRSYRPGTNVTAFANQIIAPGDIYDGTGITVTDAATLYVHGAPFQHPIGAAIGGNKWALWVYGASRFDGAVTLGNGGTKHDKIKSGVATLVAGTVTVSDSDVIASGTASASSRIFVTRMTDGGTVGTYSITRVNATSFTITSSSGSDTSTVSWLMLNP